MIILKSVMDYHDNPRLSCGLLWFGGYLWRHSNLCFSPSSQFFDELEGFGSIDFCYYGVIVSKGDCKRGELIQLI